MNEEIFKQINESCDIVDLVSNYVKLEKRGANYMGLCPFHDEKTPSFSVSPSKHLAVCMGCKKGGAPISFLSQIENIPYIEAAKRLADRLNIKMDYSIKEKPTDKYKNLYEITAFAQKYYKMYLDGSKLGLEAKDYLHNRGLSDETINRFNIGLAPNDRHKLTEALKQKGYNEIDCLSVGLLKNTENSNYDLFQNRIMFPIYDEDDNVLGFSGRIFNSNDPSKYVNSPESVIFKKGNVLFNLNNAKKEIRRKNSCILVEGQLDVISLYNAGITNALCSMGTALTANQASLIKKYTSNVVVAYDGDNAGQNAIMKAIGILKGAGLNIEIVVFNDNLDPDEYLKKYGASGLNELFSKPINEYDFKYLYSFRDKDLNNISHIEIIKRNIFDIIKESNSNTVRDILLRRLATDIYVSVDSLIDDYNKYNTISNNWKNVEKVQTPIKSQENKITAYDKAIANLIFLSFEDKEILDNILKETSGVGLLDSRIILLGCLNEFYKETNKVSTTLEEFKEYLKNKSGLNFLDLIDNLNPERITPKTKKDKLLKDSIKKYIDLKRKLKFDECSKKIKSTPNDTEKLMLINEKSSLKKMEEK